MGITWYKNESGKTVLITDRESYIALDASQKAEIKRYFRFSRYIPGWISKAQGESIGVTSVLQSIKAKEIVGPEVEQIKTKAKEVSTQKKTAAQSQNAEKYDALLKAASVPAPPPSKYNRDKQPSTKKATVWGVEVRASMIPYRSAYEAYRNSSFSPDVRAVAEQEGFLSYFVQLEKQYKEKVTTAAQKADLKAAMIWAVPYLQGKVMAQLSAKSRTASSMITGGSGFNTRRNQKRLDSSHKRLTEVLDAYDRIEKRVLSAIKYNRDPNEVEESQTKALEKAVFSSLEALYEFDGDKYTVAAKPNTYSPQLIKSGVIRDIERAQKDGQREAVISVVRKLKSYQINPASTAEIFRKNHKVWQYLPESERNIERADTASPLKRAQDLLKEAISKVIGQPKYKALSKTDANSLISLATSIDRFKGGIRWNDSEKVNWRTISSSKSTRLGIYPLSKKFPLHPFLAKDDGGVMYTHKFTPTGKAFVYEVRAILEGNGPSQPKKPTSMKKTISVINHPDAAIKMTKKEWAATPRDYKSIILHSSGDYKERYVQRMGGLKTVFISDIKPKTNEKAQSKTQSKGATVGRTDTPKKTPRQNQAKSQNQTQAAKGLSQFPPIKYEDIGQPAPGGRIMQEWSGSTIIPLYPKFREGAALPNTFKYWDHEELLKRMNLRAWEFGNWVTQEDRLNYVCASSIAMYDMATALGFPQKEMGLKGKLSIAIGARGKSRARAHFEPSTFAINMTRYENNPTDREIDRYPWLTKFPKQQRFLSQGGVGALSHEYGHALDYFFGGFVDQDAAHFALTQGRYTRTRPDEKLMKAQGMRGDTERLLNAIIWKATGQYSDYYAGVRAYMKKKKIKSEYWIRRNELFARAFEQYVGWKLEQKGLQNLFLHKDKYEHQFYLSTAELNRVAPYFEPLISKMRAYFKK